MPTVLDDRHDCPITGCHKRIPYAILMCRVHWSKVPRPLQTRLYRAWDRGRGAGTQAHLDAMTAAIDAVHDALREEGILLIPDRDPAA